MIRLILLIALLYFGLKLRRAWLDFRRSRQFIDSRMEVNRIDDIMVKDPFCQAYFPKREGVRQQVDGQELYFCSEECRRGYMANRGKG